MCILRRDEGHTWSDSSESLVLPPWTTLARPELWWSLSGFFLIIVSSTLQVRESFSRRAPRECWESFALRDLPDPPHPPSFDYWVIIVIMRNMFLQVFFLSITRVNRNDQQSIICAIQNLFHLSFTWVGHIGTSFFSYLHVGWNKKCLCSIFTSVHFFCILHAMW